MAFVKGHKKAGGRKKGAPNKDTQALWDMAQKLGINPFKVQLLFAAGDWKSLGYPKRTTTKFSADGAPYEVDVISPELRQKSAADACPYLFAKRATVEITDTDGQSLVKTLADMIKGLDKPGSDE